MSDTARPKTAGDKLTADEISRDLPVQATGGETISVASNPIPVYVKDADGECYKTDASFNDERIHSFVGFAVTDVADTTAFALQHLGVVSGFTGLDLGAEYYLSDTPGAISTTAGTYKKLIGIAISATEIKIIDKNYCKICSKGITKYSKKGFCVACYNKNRRDINNCSIVV